MKKRRFHEAQLVAILQQQISGQTMAQIMRWHGPERGYFPCLEKERRRQLGTAYPAQAPRRRESKTEADVCSLEFKIQAIKQMLLNK